MAANTNSFENSDGVSLGHVLGNFSRHRGKFALTFLVVLGGVYALLLVLPRTYQSESQLFVRLGRENMVLDPATLLGSNLVMTGPPSRTTEINSVAALLCGRELAQNVVDAVGPERILEKEEDVDVPLLPVTLPDRLNPFPKLSLRDKAIAEFVDNLDVSAVEESSVINVAYQAHDPKLAQDVVKLLVEEYLVHHAAVHRNTTTGKFLDEQLDGARRQLEAAEEQLRVLRGETGLVAPKEQSVAVVNQIASLQDASWLAQREWRSAEAHSRELSVSLAGLSATEVTAHTIGKVGTAADGMREKLFELEIQREALLATRTAEHQEVQRIEEQIERARRVLVQQRHNRPDEEITTGPNETFAETNIELIRTRPLVAAAKVRVEVLREQLKEARGQLAILNNDEMRIREQERRVAIEEENYRRFVASAQQARTDQALLAEQISNVSVAQSASYNPVPVFPNVPLALIVGGVLALFAGGGVTVLADAHRESKLRAQQRRWVSNVPNVGTERLPRREAVRAETNDGTSGANGNGAAEVETARTVPR